jgi:S-adenosyl-L-methionine hydrolase (adenosine-forming)
MPIITLTSDLGDSSHYPAIIKGVILSHCPTAILVDVTHNISSFDVMQAAYLLRHTFPAYPPGTIHLIAVDPEGNSQPEGVVMTYQQQHFIGPDNGTLSLIAAGQQHAGHAITREDLLRTIYPRSFRAAWVLGPAAAFLANGGKVAELGHEIDLQDLRWGEPSYSGNCLRGKIIHIDKFGNAITNIHRGNFLQIKQNRRFEIFIRNIRLRRIVNTYADVAKADALAIFGEGDHLEIAMREASAAELLGLKVHDMITIEFTGSG